MSTQEGNVIEISIQNVLNRLEAGEKRSDIGVALGLTKGQTAKLFQHPKLKGRKTHTSIAALNIVDDAPNVAPLTRNTRTTESATPATESTTGTDTDEVTTTTNVATETSAEAQTEAETPAAVVEPEVQAVPDTVKSPWER